MTLSMEEARVLVAERLRKVPKGSRWEGVAGMCEGTAIDGEEAVLALRGIATGVVQEPIGSTEEAIEAMAAGLVCALIAGYEIGLLEGKCEPREP